MDLLEITDNLIDHLILKIPTDRDKATEAVFLSVAWLVRRGFLKYDESQPAVEDGQAEASEYDLLKEIRKTARRYKELLLLKPPAA